MAAMLVESIEEKTRSLKQRQFLLAISHSFWLSSILIWSFVLAIIFITGQFANGLTDLFDVFRFAGAPSKLATSMNDEGKLFLDRPSNFGQQRAYFHYYVDDEQYGISHPISWIEAYRNDPLHREVVYLEGRPKTARVGRLTHWVIFGAICQVFITGAVVATLIAWLVQFLNVPLSDPSRVFETASSLVTRFRLRIFGR